MTVILEVAFVIVLVLWVVSIVSLWILSADPSSWTMPKDKQDEYDRRAGWAQCIRANYETTEDERLTPLP